VREEPPPPRNEIRKKTDFEMPALGWVRILGISFSGPRFCFFLHQGATREGPGEKRFAQSESFTTSGRVWRSPLETAPPGRARKTSWKTESHDTGCRQRKTTAWMWIPEGRSYSENRDLELSKDGRPGVDRGDESVGPMKTKDRKK